MKKSLLTLTAIVGLLAGANAQVANLASGVVTKNGKVVEDVINSAQATQKPHHFLNNTEGNRSDEEDLRGTIIGTTKYDLQTNSSNPNRLIVNENGAIQATWTGSAEGPNYSDRGTYYNYYTGSEWTGAIQSRLEGGTRTGWPAGGFTEAGEIILSHEPITAYSLYSMTRATAGTGDWTVAAVPNSGIWARTATVGDTVYVIYANGTGDEDADSYKTMFGRSYDMGATWDTIDMLLPGLDTAYRMSGDSYSIRAEGSNVWIVTGNSAMNLWLYSSTDYGKTFTRKTIFDIGLDGYNWLDAAATTDTNGDGNIDTILSHDASPGMLIDENGKAHVWVGKFTIMDDGTSEGYSYFASLNQGLWYWNEYMDEGTMVTVSEAKIIDLNENGTDISNEYGVEYGAGNAGYGIANISMAGAAIDKNTGIIYVVYSAPTELTDLDLDLTDADQLPYRDLYGYTGTPDSNSEYTWTPPVNLTNSARLFYENVYPQVADMANGKVHVMWQRDDAPGISVGEGAMDQSKENSIVYEAFDYSDFANAAPVARIDTASLSKSTMDFKAHVVSGDARSFRWDFGDGLISNERNTRHAYTENDTYEVTLRTANPWGHHDTSITISRSGIGMEEYLIENSVSVYPNPSAGNVTVDLVTLANETIEVSVHNTLGAKVQSTTDAGTGSKRIELNLENEVNGLYFVQIKVADEVITKSVTLNK